MAGRTGPVTTPVRRTAPARVRPCAGRRATRSSRRSPSITSSRTRSTTRTSWSNSTAPCLAVCRALQRLRLADEPVLHGEPRTSTRAASPRDLLPHDDLEAYGGTLVQHVEVRRWHAAQVDHGLSRDGGAVRPRWRQLGARLQRRRPTTKTRNSSARSSSSRAQGNDTVQLDRRSLLPASEKTRDQTRLVTADGLFDLLTALEPFIDFNNPADPLAFLYSIRYALELTVDFDNHQTTTDYAGLLPRRL